MNGDTKRFLFLDGLRGWAAVVVLFHHVFVDGLPANDVMADKTLWAKIFLMNGTFAVCLFFVISGFSLSIRFLQTGDERDLARMAAGRYLRLALPIFVICAVTYALLSLNIIPPGAQRPSPLVRVAFQCRKLQSIIVDHVLCIPRLVHGIRDPRDIQIVAPAQLDSGSPVHSPCNRRAF